MNFMCTNEQFRGALAICFGICLLILGCAKQPFSGANIAQDTDLIVSNQFRQIYVQLRYAMDDSDHFPHSFAELNQLSVDKNLFVCPGTGSRATALATIEEWTDYIYIGNDTEQVPRAALVISPPENHRGEYGYVLFVDGVILRLPPDQVRMLVKEPWLLATNTPPDNVNYLKKRIAVHVPKRLQTFYPDAYNSGI
jgi:hypothetical protein